MRGTARNLLLVSLGGPSCVTKVARSLGNTEARLDRFVTALNEALHGDRRCTTTPAEMLLDLRKLVPR